jgi:hypothetical protein
MKITIAEMRRELFGQVNILFFICLMGSNLKMGRILFMQKIRTDGFINLKKCK